MRISDFSQEASERWIGFQAEEGSFFGEGWMINISLNLEGRGAGKRSASRHSQCSIIRRPLTVKIPPRKR